MRIAQVSPLFESVPPQLYGGTERVVHWLTEELVAAGHEVTLFASGDSRTHAKLVPLCDRALRLEGTCADPTIHHVREIEEVYRRGYHFDLVHFHIDHLHFPIASRQRVPHLTTLHGRLDLPDLQPLYRTYPNEPVVSISDAQRAPLEGVNWQGTVHHGLPPALLRPGGGDGGYLAFLGRMSREKRPDRAVAIARAAGVPLRMAAKVDRGDQDYFDATVRPLLAGPGVEFIGEIDDGGKSAFLGDAAALLFPIEWPEPFGLVLIEAMACGTPVIAWRHGSVPELVEEGVTGFIVESADEAVEAVGKLSSFDRRRCRLRFEERFTAARMARDYVQIYRRMLWGAGARAALRAS